MEFIKFTDKKGKELFAEWIITEPDTLLREVAYYNSIFCPLDKEIYSAWELVSRAEGLSKAGNLMFEEDECNSDDILL